MYCKWVTQVFNDFIHKACIAFFQREVKLIYLKGVHFAYCWCCTWPSSNVDVIHYHTQCAVISRQIFYIINVFTVIRVRSEALKRLSWYLSNEEGGSRRLPVFSELDVTNLANVLIVDTPRSVDDDLGRSVFQVGLWGFMYLYIILDVKVLKKAADIVLKKVL